MADKGDVYYCTSEKTETDTYVGWELRRPALRAEVDSLLNSKQLAVINDSRCDRDPRLPTREEVAEFPKKHGYKVPFRPNA